MGPAPQNPATSHPPDRATPSQIIQIREAPLRSSPTPRAQRSPPTPIRARLSERGLPARLLEQLLERGHRRVTRWCPSTARSWRRWIRESGNLAATIRQHTQRCSAKGTTCRSALTPECTSHHLAQGCTADGVWTDDLKHTSTDCGSMYAAKVYETHIEVMGAKP